MPRHPLSALALLVGLFLCGSPATSQLVPAGPRIHPTTVWLEKPDPRVAAAPDGRFALLWSENRSDFGVDVRVRTYDALGVPAGLDGRLSESAGYFRPEPEISMGEDGSGVAVWLAISELLPGGSDAVTRIAGRRFDPAGSPVGPELAISGEGRSFSPAVTHLSGGGFAVAWVRFDPASGIAAFARVHGADGLPLGAPFEVGAGETATGLVGIVPDSGGGFAVSWFETRSEIRDGVLNELWSLRMRRFNPAGVPLGPVAEVLDRESREMDVARAPDGTLLFVGTDGRQPVALRAGPDGVPLGEVFAIGSILASSSGADPRATVDAHGRFLVVWRSRTASGDSVRGRVVEASGRLSETLSRWRRTRWPTTAVPTRRVGGSAASS